MFFQMRASRGGREQFHGAVIGPDAGRHSRNYRAVAELGAELERVGEEIRGSLVPARVAVLFDWEAWWAWNNINGPEPHADYLDEVHRWYAALVRRGIAVDVVSPHAGLGRYALVIAPLLFLVDTEAERAIDGVVRRGGRVVATSLFGTVDADAAVRQGEAPVAARALAGVWEEESCTMDPGETVALAFGEGSGDRAVFGAHGAWVTGLVQADEGTEVLARFDGGDYAPGEPAVTRRTTDGGQFLYVATLPGAGAIELVLDAALAGLTAGPDAVVEAHPVPDGVECTVREAADGTRFRFFVNGTDEARTVARPAGGTDLLSGTEVALGSASELEPYGVAVVRERRR